MLTPQRACGCWRTTGKSGLLLSPCGSWGWSSGAQAPALSSAEPWPQTENVNQSAALLGRLEWWSGSQISISVRSDVFYLTSTML